MQPMCSIRLYRLLLLRVVCFTFFFIFMFCVWCAKNRVCIVILGVSNSSRKKWTEEEVKAVEDKLLECITSGRVPGKLQCEDCIRSAPSVLKHRTWEMVKFIHQKPNNGIPKGMW